MALDRGKRGGFDQSCGKRHIEGTETGGGQPGTGGNAPIAGGGVVDRSKVIDAALFDALRYMWFANTAARWERIRFALDVESDLTDLIG